MSAQARNAADLIRRRVPSTASPDTAPTVGIVLGSGLGGLADRLQDATAIEFADLPGFPVPSVQGHAGRLVLGQLSGRNVACLQGRVHLYEGHPAQAVVPMIRTLRLLGCQTLIATNAAGALDPNAKPGSLMLITDHINFLFSNPLVGPNDERVGPRFPPMDGAYDAELQQRLRETAARLGIALTEGVYLATLGPTFETPAEIRAFGVMGANAVGMSTVPETIVARHAGMRVAAVSVLTNLAAGLGDQALSHDQTLEFSALAAEDLQKLIIDLVGQL